MKNNFAAILIIIALLCSLLLFSSCNLGNTGNGNDNGNIDDSSNTDNTDNKDDDDENNEEALSPYMEYYISQINNKLNQYNGIITSDWNLPTEIVYAPNRAYRSSIVWTSSDANVFSDEGVFTKQTYDKPITLTAHIYSYLNSEVPESTDIIEFTLVAKGAYSTPTKSEVVSYLQKITNGTLSGTNTIEGGEIDCDLNLIRKVSNTQVDSASGSAYEVRIEWLINNNGNYEPISQIHRGTSEKSIDLVATITFNGAPLEDDGKVYFDDVSLTAITEDEIRYHIIKQIASKVSNSFSSGDELWDDDSTYGCDIKWISKDVSTISIEQNVVNVNEQAVDGTSCPIAVQISYPTDSGSNSFTLEYVITIKNDNNTLLRPGVNISESLYYALLMEMRDRFGYTQLTTEALKNTKFVSLDLSKYGEWFEDGAGDLHPPITDLAGLTYCENLRLLNISGLSISGGISEIAGLSYLESFIAKNTGISDEAVGGAPVLSNMINLKLVDLSNNSLTSLDTFFSDDDIYSKLKEVFLDNNNLSDISLLSQMPMITTLTLSNNDIDSEDISVLADKVYLEYLSLNNNNISDISSLKKLTALTELRLHCNSIKTISPLKDMTLLKNLYLGDNNIADISDLRYLELLEVLYLNDNEHIADILDLYDMRNMKILNISNCSVNQINSLKNMSELRELYAENNEIAAFAPLSYLTGLEKLLIAGNERSSHTPDWNAWIGNMSNLKVLTLSGLNVYDLSFLETVTTESTTTKPIERLELADCAMTSEYVVDENTTIDNIALLNKLELSLKYLDISNNPIESNVEKLSLSSLELLYADNINIGKNIYLLMEYSQSMKYLSLENCNISDMFTDKGKPWLSVSKRYVFIDLAQNPISTFNFDYVSGSASSLKSLYLDTTSEDAIVSSMTKDYDDSAMIELSLEGFKVKSTDVLPDMNNLKVLNLSYTQINDLYGQIVGEEYPYSISRYTNLSYLNIGGNDGIFTSENLNLLYDSFGKTEVIVYLYSDQNFVGFDRERDIDYVNQLAKQDPLWNPSGFNIVNYRNSHIDDDPSNDADALEYSRSFNGFDIVWSVDDPYVIIEDNVLSVVNIATPNDSYVVELRGLTRLYGEECEFEATRTFTKSQYHITYAPDSEIYSHSKRAVKHDPRNVTSYNVDGNDVIIYDPTRGDYDYFLGWYEDENFTIPFNNDLKDNPRDVTLYTKWDVATYYDSIDETPWSTPAGRVVIDWSKEADTNLLNHTNRSVMDKRYNNIDISAASEEIIFIGNESKTYDNFMMNLCRFSDGQKLTISFVNFNFVTNGNTAICLWEDSGVDLTIDVIGSCSIKSSYPSGNIIGRSDTVVNNLTFTGNGSMNIIAGSGTDGQSAGASGTDGGIAVYATTMSMNMNGILNITGGTGGNGIAGKAGDKGNSYRGHGSNDCGDRTATGDGADGGDGTDGCDGGNAGKGGFAYAINNLIINSGSLTATGGQSGNAGAGGAGGDGGRGQDTGGWWGTAGDGGDGGNGADGGDTFIVAVSDKTETIVINGGDIQLIDGKEGSVGPAGTAGNAGGKGYHCEHVSSCDQDFTWGYNGSDGSAGEAGDPGTCIDLS